FDLLKVHRAEGRGMSHGMSQVSNEAAQPFSTPPMAVSDVRVPPTVVTDRRPYAENRGVPVSTALKQIAMTPDDMRALRRIALKTRDRKSTRLNSSHVKISYAVFCLKKKT